MHCTRRKKKDLRDLIKIIKEEIEKYTKNQTANSHPDGHYTGWLAFYGNL